MSAIDFLLAGLVLISASKLTSEEMWDEIKSYLLLFALIGVVVGIVWLGLLFFA
jgi:hypothetical protein